MSGTSFSSGCGKSGPFQVAVFGEHTCSDAEFQSRNRHNFFEIILIREGIHGTPYRKRVAEYLEAVRARQSPQTLGEPFLMEVLSVEITGAMAVVSVSVPIFGFQYRDYLSLIREGDTWLIVNKLFVDTRV